MKVPKLKAGIRRGFYIRLIIYYPFSLCPLWLSGGVFIIFTDHSLPFLSVAFVPSVAKFPRCPLWRIVFTCAVPIESAWLLRHRLVR